MNGMLFINKEEGMTSRDVVNRICHLLQTKKVGHTGTLDPMATGVMIVCVGSATKLVEIVTADQKEYVAQIILGKKTDTGDITGNILEEENVHISYESILKATKQMKKTYFQTVPIYSAVKINGKKLYEYAREGKQVELPKREVTIYELEILDKPYYEEGKTIFQIRTLVSKGTYIRSLIEDLAAQLNTIGTMSSLTRTKQGTVTLEMCNTLKDIEANIYKMYDTSSVLSKYPKVTVDAYLENRIRNGSILENRYDSEVILFETGQNKPLALYKIYEKDKTKMKPWKML